MIDHHSPLYRLRLAFVLLLCVQITGTVVYKFLLGLSWLDASYFTVVTMATVGYGDIHPVAPEARTFTIFFILGGIGIASYSISVLMAALIEGQIRGELKRRRMQSEIQKLSQHVILCGFGRIGGELAESFHDEEVPFVIIERDDEMLHRCEAQKYLTIKGDATSDDTLREAGIERARAIVPALASDADNLFIVISARQLNPSLSIIARATDEATAAKMAKAGADKTVRPLSIGAQHFAQAVLRPTVMDFIQISGRNSQQKFQIEEVHVEAASTMTGKSLIEINLRKEVGVVLIGIKRAGGDLIFNPSAEAVIQNGDTLVAMGDEAQLCKLWQMAGAAT